MEYGILLYRSEESLKQFRAKVLLENESPGNLEEAFLQQDCLFLTFDSDRQDDDEDEDDIIDLADLPQEEIEPSFGNIHPLEGLRSVLYEEEAIAMYVALEGLNRFIRDERDILSEEIALLKHKYKISLPPSEISPKAKPVAVTVATMPQLTAELEEMTFDGDDELDATPMFQSLRDDLIPEDSFLSLGVVSWEMVDYLRRGAIYHQQVGQPTQTGDGLPVILIQTSRPKAMTIISAIQEAGGIKGIGFNPGADPFEGESYDLGVLKTENSEMFLFGEFLDQDPVHVAARKKWDERCKHTRGYCGLIIARGLMGASRGQPHLKDMMALFEGHSLSPKELGIGTLQLMPQLE